MFKLHRNDCRGEIEALKQSYKELDRDYKGVLEVNEKLRIQLANLEAWCHELESRALNNIEPKIEEELRESVSMPRRKKK